MTNSVCRVVFDGFQLADMAPVWVFVLANALPRDPHYNDSLLPDYSGMARSLLDLKVDCIRFVSPLRDTLSVTGALAPNGPTLGIIDFLHESTQASRCTARICTGTFVLAEADLTASRRVTTHGVSAPDLQPIYLKLMSKRSGFLYNMVPFGLRQA